MSLKIAHVDCDCFFAAVEMLDNPKLRGKPVIVGGKGGRGVVATCSYEARKFGVHSAMPMFMARQKCPHGIFVTPRRERYKEVSRAIFRIFRLFTPLVEPVSIDEAYMDLSHYGSGIVEAARKIKERVKEETGITISVGVAPNKFLAKLASDLEKPDGFTVIRKEQAQDVLRDLPVNKLRGVGPRTEAKMHRLGCYKISDLYRYDLAEMKRMFGKHGEVLYRYARGEDHRTIETRREAKSVSREKTLAYDTSDLEELATYLREFAYDVGKWLHERGYFARTVTVKIKDRRFREHSKSVTLQTFTQDETVIWRTALELLHQFELDEDVRLIGLGVSNLELHPTVQLSFFDGELF